MNKNDFDRFWTACVPREARASNENIFDDVIKAIDNSEKYKHLTESKLLEQYRERGQKIHELSQIVKLLKKLKKRLQDKGEKNMNADAKDIKWEIEAMLNNQNETLGDEEFIKKFKIGYEDEE